MPYTRLTMPYTHHHMPYTHCHMPYTHLTMPYTYHHMQRSLPKSAAASNTFILYQWVGTSWDSEGESSTYTLMENAALNVSVLKQLSSVER